VPTTPPGHRARKTVSIVFSDLVGSTSLGEDLDAESLREVMDEYFETMRSVLERHSGVVEKFIGDAVMAVFGLARTHEDDALRAVRAAVEMRIALADLNQRLPRGVTLRSRTGVNTGVVVVGDGGGGQRLATGDVVNVAARLEQMAPEEGIVLGGDTFRLVREYVEASSIGLVRPRGRSETIEAWELVALDESRDRRLQAFDRRSLIGRSAQLAAIEEGFARAASEGRLESVLVVGEPGVGKSRLVSEVVARLGPKATVLSGACRPYGTSSFWPVAEWLTCLSERGQPIDVEGLRAMARVLPREERDAVVERVGSLLGLTTNAVPVEDSFWATARLLAAVRPTDPLLLLVEDLHWPEDTLLELLARLRLHPRRAGTLILATARAELLERCSPVDTKVVQLLPLTDTESDELIDAVLGPSRLSAGARSLLHQASQGNPLFVEQALATWMEEGVLVPGARGWTVATAATQVKLPASVSAIFASRLDRLPAAELQVLGAASVVGVSFERAALPYMLPSFDPTALDGCLGRLLDSHLLAAVDSDGSAGVERLVFAHACLRDVAYELTLKGERALFHERFAGWLEGGDTSSRADGLIGHHLAEAHRYHTELRHTDLHMLDLAHGAATHLTAHCQRALRIGDRSGAERTSGLIMELLSPYGPEIGASDMPLMEAAAGVLMTTGRWRETVALLHPCVELRHGPLLRDLGVALCQLHRSQPASPEYLEGQRLLGIAAAPPNRDVDALASLAGTWKGVDDGRAHMLYRRCLDLDPSDPYALGNVLEFEIATSGDLSVLADLRDQVVQASRRCRSQADAGSNLPWAFFDRGKFALLLGQPSQAMRSYAKAVHLTTADHMLVTSIASLDRLQADGADILGLSWARQLMTLARVVRFRSPASLGELGPVRPIAGVNEHTQVVMLAGGTDPAFDRWLADHDSSLADGFANFQGVLISGGTGQGVAGLTASLKASGERITALGYLPGRLPEDANIDRRYDELRESSGSGFSIAESLQAWGDLIASRSGPSTVKLLGLNGGEIAAAEYRVALALGATVGIVIGSGREADDLLEDADWFALPNLVRLEAEAEDIRRFVSADSSM